MTKKNKEERIRKIGQREEIVSLDLDTDARDEASAHLLVLLNDEEGIKERLKEQASTLRAELKTNQLEQKRLRRELGDGKRKETLMIEEWLTKGNEIIRIRADDGSQVGDVRKARAEELQEEMFQDSPAPQNAAVAGVDEFPAMEDDFGGVAH